MKKLIEFGTTNHMEVMQKIQQLEEFHQHYHKQQTPEELFEQKLNKMPYTKKSTEIQRFVYRYFNQFTTQTMGEIGWYEEI